MDRTHEIHADGPKGTICEKLRRSLAIRPAKQPFNQVSYIQQVPKPYSAPSRNMYENKRGNGGAVPIEFDRSAFRNGKHGNGHIEVEGKPKPRFIGKNTETETKMNDTFSDYIYHAKMKISRTSSDVGARGVARLDSVNKRASAYIDRARQKIRNSATFRAGTFQKK
ncbi:hypothetical protein QQ045_026352 [Rhodiola kirilowii]